MGREYLRDNLVRWKDQLWCLKLFLFIVWFFTTEIKVNRSYPFQIYKIWLIIGCNFFN